MAAVSAPAGYQLSSNDAIAVEVFGEEDLRTTARLNSEGNVSLPLIGAIHLGGLTVTQATARVTEFYARDYLVSPKVNVTLLGYARRRFTVLGQVNHPGSFEMPETSPGGIDLLEAIAMAGGYTRIAAPERVSVRRHVGNGDELVRVNAKRVERGQSANFKVLPGDKRQRNKFLRYGRFAPSVLRTRSLLESGLLLTKAKPLSALPSPL